MKKWDRIRWLIGSSAFTFVALAPNAIRAMPADSLETITTDTGAFAPGNRNLARFTLPEICVAAVRQAAAVARRDVSVQFALRLLQDTAPERDTLPRTAFALAQQCNVRFSVAATAAGNLPALFTLALQAGNDAKARAVVERRLVLASDAKARQAVFAEAAEGYAAAEPARLAEAAWVAAKADTLAYLEHTNSLPAHFPLLTLATRAFDRPRMRAEAKRLITLGQTLDFHAIQYEDVPLIEAWSALLQAAFFDHPDSVLALANQAKEDLRRFPLGLTFPNGIPYVLSQVFDFSQASVTEVRNFLVPFNPDQYVGANALPLVEAPYWFPAKPTRLPPRGNVTLVLYGGWVMSCARTDVNLLTFPMSKACAPLHTYLREWTEQLSSSGFALMLVERTNGHAVRSVPLSPAAEADSVNWYYRRYLKMPGTTVAVVPRALIRQVPQEADGRRWTADTTALGRLLKDDNQMGIFHGIAMLYGRDGQLLYVSRETLDNALVHALIVRALAVPPTAAGGSTSGFIDQPVGGRE